VGEKTIRYRGDQGWGACNRLLRKITKTKAQEPVAKQKNVKGGGKKERRYKKRVANQNREGEKKHTLHKPWGHGNSRIRGHKKGKKRQKKGTGSTAANRGTSGPRQKENTRGSPLERQSIKERGEP